MSDALRNAALAAAGAWGATKLAQNRKDRKAAKVEREHRHALEKTYASSGGSGGGGRNSFTYKVESLTGLKHELQVFHDDLLEIGRRYEKALDDMLENEGIAQETYRDLREQALEPTQALIRQLAEHIDSQDIPLVQREISDHEAKT